MANIAMNDLIRWFETLTPDSLPAIRTFYAPDAWFRDPFQELTNRDAIEALFAKMFRTLDNPRFVITDRVIQDGSAFLVWDFHFRLRGRDCTITGGSHLKTDAQGRITHHRDYWDAAEELYEKLPVLGFVLRQIKKRI